MSNQEESKIKDSKLWTIVRDGLIAINRKFKIKYFSRRPIAAKKVKDRINGKKDEKRERKNTDKI